MAGRTAEMATRLARRTTDTVRDVAGRTAKRAHAAANEGLYRYLFGTRAADAHTDELAIYVNGRLNPAIDYRLGTTINVGNAEPQPLQMDSRTMAKNYKALFLPAFIADPDPTGDFTRPDPEKWLEQYDEYSWMFKRFLASNRRFRDVRTKEDLIDVISRRRAVALMKSVEGIYVTEDNYLHAINTLIADGVISFGLKWNFDDNIGATTKPSIRDKAEKSGIGDPGLGDVGRKVVERIDQKGGIIDLAHASDKTIWDVLAIPSAKPRIISHAASREVKKHNRNVTDEIAQLIVNGGTFVKEGTSYRVLAEGEKPAEGVEVHTVDGGGIIGMPFVAGFVGTNAAGVATEKEVVKHLKHFKEIGVLKGVVLGSDFNGMGQNSVVQGLEDASVFRERLINEMRNQGFTPTEIRGIFSETQLKFLLKNLPRKNSLPRSGEEASIYTAA